MSEKKIQTRTGIKGLLILLFLISSLLVLSGCAEKKAVLIGNWELVPSEGELNDTAMTGYVFGENGSVTFYNGYDGKLTISEGQWQISGINKNYLELFLDEVDTPERNIRFKVADETLYFFSDSGEGKTTYDSCYKKTDQFSFEALIAAAKKQKAKEKQDAQLFCTLSPTEIIEQLKAAGQPIGQVVVYTDPDYATGLLKQPNLQLAQAARFEDTSIEQAENQIEPIGGSVEVYKDYAVAKQRYDYLTVFSDAAGSTYQIGNVLLRLDNALQSEKRAPYEDAFLRIVK
ncbi:hypothetical protein DSECCO2_452370 [anaerobic digester metagenome]|uniref:hypothetical protein n=1 Tax=Acetobacterium wieringae TaxID=52694 RepID=UPI0020333890|nr:hypothetical protein [Acetobacterium wieringae]URN84533.1 hypothetical protein CHL1_000097 [Acetobacterium wieringae]